MFRSVLSSCGRLGSSMLRCSQQSFPQVSKALLASPSECGTLRSSALRSLRPFSVLQSFPQAPFNSNLLVPKTSEVNVTRSLIKYSLQKGKRKTVRAVLKRFYRLDWGIWIRTKCGRHKKMYKKSYRRRRRLRQHVFTNATQSWLLDTMVTRYWRKPKYYPDDPYNPYHKREEFPFTKKIPKVPVAY